MRLSIVKESLRYILMSLHFTTNRAEIENTHDFGWLVGLEFSFFMLVSLLVSGSHEIRVQSKVEDPGDAV